jgi:hypothetical protein
MKIEKGILPPEARAGRREIYPFSQMQIGDSFYSEAARENVANAAYGYGKRHGQKFSVLRDGDGFRCWRIA